MEDRHGPPASYPPHPLAPGQSSPPQDAAGADKELAAFVEPPDALENAHLLPAPEGAPLATALTATPARAVAARPALAPPRGQVVAPPPGRLIPPFFWAATFALLVVLAAAFVYPLLLARWRSVEGQAEAEAAYQRRRAELRAEAEAATQMLGVLDKRVNLVSLGFREVVRKVTPNVVNVTNYRAFSPKKPGEAGARGTVLFDPDTEHYYRQAGVGSGVIVRPGQILTNYHVVRGADRLRVTFASGQSVGVDVAANVRSDAVTDLAVIRLPADLPCALCDDLNLSTEFADSDRDVHRGDLVLALGSPLGLKQTVTHGIISAKGRLLDKLTLVELLQTDAAINPGNSGGPLFDQYGRVAGINVAIASDNGGNQGIGFAIPSNTARKVFEQLADKGEVVRGYLGVALGELPRAQAEALGLTRKGGVLIAQVVPDQAAGKAGLRSGDVIVRYNKQALSAVMPMRQLRQWILETDVGRVVPVEVLRDRRRHTLSLRIGKRPADLP